MFSHLNYRCCGRHWWFFSSHFMMTVAVFDATVICDCQRSFEIVSSVGCDSAIIFILKDIYCLHWRGYVPDYWHIMELGVVKTQLELTFASMTPEQFRTFHSRMCLMTVWFCHRCVRLALVVLTHNVRSLWMCQAFRKTEIIPLWWWCVEPTWFAQWICYVIDARVPTWIYLHDAIIDDTAEFNVLDHRHGNR